VPQFPLELQGPKRILWSLDLFNYTYSTVSKEKSTDCYGLLRRQPAVRDVLWHDVPCFTGKRFVPFVSYK